MKLATKQKDAIIQLRVPREEKARYTKEAKEKISLSKLGNQHSVETKQKMRESRKRYLERLKLNIEQN